MLVIDLDKEIQIPNKGGGVEIIRIGDLLRRKLKKIRYHVMCIGCYGDTGNIRDEIHRCVSDIADVLGITGTRFTEEELDELHKTLW